MSSATQSKFPCPACGKQFPWKDALAGKQVRCKCGHVFAATRPATAAPAPASSSSTVATASHWVASTTSPAPARALGDNEELDLYPEPEPLRRPRATVVAPPPPPPVVNDDPSHTEAPSVPSAFTAYASRRRRPAMQEEATDAPSAWKDTYMPIILASLGLLAWITMTVVYPLANVSPAKAIVVAVTMNVANVVALVLALFAAASLLSVNFGPPATALTKLVAISLFAGAVFFACMRLDYPQDIRGMIVGLHAAVIVYGICFSLMFDLELQEVAITVAIVGLVQAMAGCVVLKV